MTILFSIASFTLLAKLVQVIEAYSDLVESDPVAMAEGPNATDPAQVLTPHVGGPSVNPRPLNSRTLLDQLEEKIQVLSGIIYQVTTLEERLDGFLDDQAHMGERLIMLEGVVEGNMATLLDQVAELSSKSQSSSQSQQRTGSSNNGNKGKNGGYQARSGGDQGHGQNRSGGASTGGASSSNFGREYNRPRNNGGASSSSRFQGRPGNLKCFLCGGNHKAYQCPQKTALNALMASHGDQTDDTTQGNDNGELSTLCGGGVAVITFSPRDKAYSFGNLSADLSAEHVVDCLLYPDNYISPMQLRIGEDNLPRKEQQELDEFQRQLETEKRRAKRHVQIQNGNKFWWEMLIESINDMRLEELEKMHGALKELKTKVDKKAEEKKMKESTSLTMALPDPDWKC
ncbi:hypothetical protein GIB67_006915 [Kingdonia uniflora]|uniref:Uncharacterized protein n=1 Tax=Kingdonia uniflora TaxID=39325 RepID=A0A7J7L098_9MAGN|nr:hypothetical protein GIB67_006915 [Kingdonia uniflora]